MKTYKKIITVNLFTNTGGKVKAVNSGWSPYVDGKPGDVTLKGDVKYQVSLFENDNGSMSISISEIVDPYKGVKFDSMSEQISQTGMKSIAEALEINKEEDNNY